jgi:soluble lytic murein transglycosylase
MRRLLVAALLVTALAVIGALVWNAEPAWLDRLRYPLRYEEIIKAHAENYELEPAFLAAVINTESGFEPAARSSAGAIGLMQLLPETAEAIALRTGGGRFVVDDLYNPEINIRYGSWYLANLLDKYRDRRLALAAYHAGQGNVDRWQARGLDIQFPETRAYLERVERAERAYRRSYARELGLVPSEVAATDVAVSLTSWARAGASRPRACGARGSRAAERRAAPARCRRSRSSRPRTRARRPGSRSTSSGR